MIENILQLKSKTDFDFRVFAYPDDEFKNLFDDWVDYYRLKYAICKAINPKTILETGVRYGYSAITFLSAAENASYLGIDNDSDSYGGKTGAINWAKDITKDHNARFMIADTMEMSSFPGDYYDLIHIDGQQNGDGTFHDLEMAIKKGKYILVDGFFWSRENMLSSLFFLEKYQHLIEFALTIPAYAGEFLMKTKEGAAGIFAKYDHDYSSLRDSYDSNYFLNDCGGYEEFKMTKGEINDRLQPLYYLADMKKGQKILDVGCGRGELSYAFAASGADVIGIDYSSDAIEIADETYSPKNISNLRFVCDDFLQCDFGAKFDVIVASDFVEHIEDKLLTDFLHKMYDILDDDGRLIIHTSPNKLNYLYDYTKKRALAKQAGVYIPENPRTFYEDLMHINEQTPARLNRKLKKIFDNAITWVSQPPDVIGTLINGSKDYFAKATSIFAIASKKQITRDELISLLTQEKLAADEIDIEISSETKELTLKRSEEFLIKITINNKANKKLSSFHPFPVKISYHWFDAGSDSCEIFDGVRTRIIAPLTPSEKREYDVKVIAPDKKGEYRLQVTLVQEAVVWFDNISKDFAVMIDAKVT